MQFSRVNVMDRGVQKLLSSRKAGWKKIPVDCPPVETGLIRRMEFVRCLV